MLRSLLIIGSSLVVAAGAAAALLTFAFGDVRFFPAIFVVTLAIGGVIGLPLFFLVRSRGQANWRMAAITGFFVGAVIPALLMLMGAPEYASVGGVPTAVEGSYTAYGWLQNLLTVTLFGVTGSLGGLFFWRAARRDAGAVADDFDKPHAGGEKWSAWKMAGLASAAVALIGAAIAIPSITKDRSCHNTLRDGRDSIGPEATFDLKVSSREWREVAQDVQAFGRAGGWSIISDVRPDDNFKWFQMSLCREPGTNILVQGRPEWGEVNFTVYQPQGGNSWREPFVRLYKRIYLRWPDRIEFPGDSGQRIDPPEWVPESQDVASAK